MRSLIAAVFATIAAAFCDGCTTIRNTQPDRTATEQMMLAYATAEAVDQWHLPSSMEGKTAFLVTDYYDSYDSEFSLGDIRDQLGEEGLILVDSEKEAELRVEARSAGLGINKKDFLVGIPSFPIAGSGTGVFATPELFLFKNTKETGLANSAITIFDAETDERLLGLGPNVGMTQKADWWFLGMEFFGGKKNLPEGFEE